MLHHPQARQAHRQAHRHMQGHRQWLRQAGLMRKALWAFTTKLCRLTQQARCQLTLLQAPVWPQWQIIFDFLSKMYYGVERHRGVLNAGIANGRCN